LRRVLAGFLGEFEARPELVATPVHPKGMRRCVFAVITALACGAGVAQESDRLKSADCRQALDALQAQEASALVVPEEGQQAQAASRGEVLKRLEPLRRHAARACLGGRGHPPPPAQRFAQPGVTVPPVVIRPLALPPPLTVAPTLSLPTQVKPPLTVTTCDATGCWASDGSRLQRLGPNLLGPRGLCTVQGMVLSCP